MSDRPDGVRRGPTLSYVPALDGVRGVAIIVIMGYHSGVFLTSGGYYSLDTFFALSGFLITSLLIAEWQRSGSIRLGAFWARRARRLLPALLLLLVAVALYAKFLVPEGTYPTLRSDSLATLLYYANWHFIAIGANYFGQAGLTSPLSHTWSLAVEEQFYLLWPLIVLAVLRWARSRWGLLVLCVVGIVASASEMAVRYSPGNVNRLYFGTDTRAQSLLLGAALSVALSLWADRRRRMDTAAAPAPAADPIRPAHHSRSSAALLAVGLAGTVGTALLWTSLSTNDFLAYRGGFLLAALTTCAVILSVSCSPRSVLAAALSVRPLRYVGRISYGMYLWHLPLFFFLDGARTGLTGYSLFAVRAAATVIVSAASFHLIENPIRQGQFLRGWRAWLSAPAAVMGTATVVFAATIAPAAAATASSSGPPLSAGLVSSAPAVKVLLVGDSMADTLGNGVSGQTPLFFGTSLNLGSGISGAVGRYFGLDIINDGTPNCALAAGAYREHGNTQLPGAPCRPGSGGQRWPAIWSRTIAAEHPAVSIFLARLDIMDRLIDGHWTHIGQAAYDNYLMRQLRLAVMTLASRGGKVILLTTPYYQTGEQPDGSQWPEDDPSRVDQYNALLRQVASDDRATVFIVDLNKILDPEGRFQPSIDGIQIRYSDGIHLTQQGDCWLAPRLLPLIRQIATQHRASGPSISESEVAEATAEFPPSLCHAATQMMSFG